MPKYDPKSATRQRIIRTEAYAERIRRQFAATVNEIIALKKRMPTDVGQMYSFDGDTRKVQDEVERLLRRLHSAVTTSIEQGITLEWEQANKECDWLVQSYFGKELLKSPKFAAWTDRNDRARQAFIARSEKGLNLSDRVWKSCRQLRDEMEMAITVAIGEGNDAGSISRQIRHCLNNPDDMFRRFRYKDEDGNWQRKWKKRVKDEDGTYHWTDYDINDYHTGRGVYRSSAKNAMRVARTETNIAYRRADHERWQKMEFVLGQRIQLSKNHPMHDICDELAGDYPKDFVFDGWHPQCFCFVTPILVDASEMQKANEAFLRGEEYTPQGKQITDYPQGFKDFVCDNADKIATSRSRGTEPYFVRNNAEVIDGLINSDNSDADTKQNSALIKEFSEKLKTNEWEMSDMNKWLDMTIEDRLNALQESEISGLVPDDFFDADSMYVDIYKPTSRDSLLGSIDDVLSNVVNGYDMTDMDSYLAFYSDGRVISTRTDDYELEGKSKLPRKGLIALMSNGGVLDNRYWVKDEKGLEAIKQYTGYKTVGKGIIQDTSIYGRSISKRISDFAFGLASNFDKTVFMHGNYSDAILQNFSQIEKTLGIKRGERMSLAGADMLSSNPRYWIDSDYTINCTGCVPTFMLRLHGFEVSAMPYSTEKIKELSRLGHTFDCWITSDGKPIKPTYISNWLHKKGYESLSEKNLLEMLNESVSERGVYQITYKTKYGNGHTTILIRDDNGLLFWIEPQAFEGVTLRSIEAFIEEFDMTQFKESGVLRIDDKKINPKYFSIFRTKIKR